jgi:Protein of unknown function (DUF3667)
MTHIESSGHDNRTCANCSTPLAGRFCSNCGQEGHVQLTVRHFLGEVVEGLTHFDSTFWRTLAPLLFRPGLITERYLAGRRKHYAPPVRTYLVISIVYFLLYSLFTTEHFAVRGVGGAELNAQGCAQMATSLQWLHAILPDIEGSCLRAQADHGGVLSHTISGLLPRVMFVVLPLVALVQYWIQRRRRPLYVENLVFVLHFQSFYYLAGALFLLLTGAVTAIFGSAASSGLSRWLSLILLVWSATYIYVASRRVYQCGVVKALFNILAIALAFTIFWALSVSLMATYVVLRS